MNIVYWIIGTILGVFLASILIEFLLIRRAPEGYEDEMGFHYGREE